MSDDVGRPWWITSDPNHPVNQREAQDAAPVDEEPMPVVIVPDLTPKPPPEEPVSEVLPGSAIPETSEMPELPPPEPYQVPVETVDPEPTGPYSAVLGRGLGGEDRWDVVGANGVSAGYTKETDNSEAGAQKMADDLNGNPDEPPVHTATVGVGATTDPDILP